jgi:hypothetical protein
MLWSLFLILAGLLTMIVTLRVYKNETRVYQRIIYATASGLSRRSQGRYYGISYSYFQSLRILGASANLLLVGVVTNTGLDCMQLIATTRYG